MPLVQDISHHPFIFHSIQSFTIPKGHSQRQTLHRHPETMELLLVLEGKIECQLDHKPYTVPTGAALLIRPDTWHELEFAASEQHSGYSLSFIRNRSSLQVPEADLPPVVPVSDLHGLGALLAQLQLESAHPQLNSGLMACHLIELILLLLNRSLNPNNAISLSDLTIIQEIRHFMEENHCRSLSLDGLGNRFGLTKYQLARLFKQQTGMSPLQYIISCRMDTAKQLLTTTKRPVAAIARAIGYKSDTQFQAAFKKAVGMTPRHYRLESSAKA
ncbi:AraC family transcriptional regulator [Planococcus soli]|uniref:AraC family transcriptional regulator n=1 Tax=Planococcus soli TaxID=2666072 RepID=UPI001F397377|nr:AraC family transcriptional regulator [Planococcus soli]